MDRRGYHLKVLHHLLPHICLGAGFGPTHIVLFESISSGVLNLALYYLQSCSQTHEGRSRQEVRVLPSL
ncbi:hypothetical protein YC2023_021019 [Brassica napus]